MPRLRSLRRPRWVASLLPATLLLGSGALAAPSPGALPGRATTPDRREAAATDWLRRRASPASRVPLRADLLARGRWDALGDTPSGQTASLAPPPPQATWTEVGPAPLDTSLPNVIAGEGWSPAAGRVTAIEVDPTDPATLYVGAAVGGVWKSTDGGATWKPLTDTQPSLAIGAITMDPSDPQTLWVGTGSGEPYSGPAGQGLLLTTEGGATWTRPAGDLFAGLSISRIVLDPAAGQMYLTTDFGSAGYGDVCTNTVLDTPGQGLYRSSDGGKTWASLLEGSFDDLEIDTTVMPRILFADEVFTGAHRSIDGGATWADPGGLPTGTDRVQFTIAPSDPTIVYAGVGLQGEGSLWVSTDRGATFAEVPGVPSYCEGQCFFDNTVAVKPDDPTTVYLGGALCSVWKIADAMSAAPLIAAVSQPNGDCGTDFANWYKGYVHPDTHAMAFDPTAPDTLYVGSDGGLARTTDGGATWERLNEGVGTIQFYSICADPNDPVRLYGGSQDNGAMMRAEPGTKWVGLSTGDGTGCAVDAADSMNAMLTVQYGAAFVTTDGFDKKIDYAFDTQKPYCAGLAGCGDRAGFVPPVAGHPTSPSTFFIGTYRLWRSLSGGKKGTWKPISGDLTGGPGSAPCVFGGFGAEDDTLTAIGLSRSAPTTLYTGSAGGVVSVTTDDGATWKSVASPAMPNRWVSGFAVDPADPNIVSVGFSGFDATTPDRPGHVFRSTDGGASWALSDIGMDAPVNHLIGHPSVRGLLYAATDFGVLVSSDAGATWAKLGVGFPTAPVYSLAFRAKTGTLVAATFGRSAWEIGFTPSLGATPAQLSFEAEEGSDPAPQTLSLFDQEPYGSVLPVTAASDTPWVGAAGSGQAGGSVKVDVTVTVTAKDKGIGDYDGSVTVTAAAGVPSSLTVPVHLHVGPKALPDGGPDGGDDDVLASGGGCACRAATSSGAPPLPSALGIAFLALAAAARRRPSRR